MSRVTFALAAALSLLAATAVDAADKIKEVKFKPGATSATITDTLKGYDTSSYILGASAGQRIGVSFKASNASCYYNVNAPTGDEAMFNGSMTSDQNFADTLTESGDYRTMVYLMRNAARRDETCKFTITFEVTD